MDLETIIENLTNKIKELEPNTETSIPSLLGKDVITNYSSNDLFDIYIGVINKCKEENIDLDFSKYKGQIVGLPYNIPFIKK